MDQREAGVDAEARVQMLLERVKRCPGYVYPFNEFLARHDPDWAEAYQTLYEHVRRERWLPLKYKELLFITSSCIKPNPTGIRTHITKALELGATREEILETIEVASLTGGGHVPVLAVTILIEVLEGRKLAQDPIWVGTNNPE